MKIWKAVILSLLFVALSVFWGYEICGAMKEHWMLLMRWFKDTKVSYYPWYLWVLGGGCIFPLMNKFFVRNMDLIKTHTHEFTHVVTGLLLFREIHSIHVESMGTGEVWSSGNSSMRFLMSLAAYCFVIYTFPLLMLRCLVVVQFLPIMDVIIGFSLGLHIVCFAEQLGNYQTDINQFPLWFSYIYIVSVWLFELSLIFMSYIPQSNIFHCFVDYAVDFWNLLTS